MAEQPKDERAKPRHAVTPPAITLPKGGGAIRGVGEKFTANPVTGTASFSVPIATSDGRSGVGPRLALSYDSGAGNGPFGLGWTLAIPSVTRKTDKGLPRYDDTDVFLFSGAEDLVPVGRKDAAGEWLRDGAGRLVPHEHERDGYVVRRYRPRIEGLFARIERWTRKADGDVHWRTITKDNVLTIYGRDAESRIADPEDGRRVFTWLICESRDDRGNAVVYRYKAEDGAGVSLAAACERNRGARDDGRRTANRYLARILYGNRLPLLDGQGRRPRIVDPGQLAAAQWMFEVVFDYGEHDAADPKPDDAGEWARRRDPFSTRRSGFEIRTNRLCRRVLMFHHFPGEPDVGANCLVRSTSFAYRESATATFLTSITHSRHRRAAAGGYDTRSIPSVEFDYSLPRLGSEVRELDPESVENLPVGVDGRTWQWLDLDGEGLSGVTSDEGGAWLYKRNVSALERDEATLRFRAGFAAVERVGSVPAGATDARVRTQFLDLAGDGQVDLVALSGAAPGLYERGDAGEWETFRSFLSLPNVNWHDPNLKFIDLTGDGHADVLVTEEHAFTWFASLGEEGFGEARSLRVPTDEESGPRLVFADPTQTLFLADLSGDGLTDIVRVRNGEICYWPNLGYGRFGAKITMDDAPWFDAPDQFDPQRIRLVDVDGSGVSDIVYLGRQRTTLYLNHSGNAWSAGEELVAFPTVDDVTSVAAVDLLGTGTACLVWSSPLPGSARAPLRYLELMAEGKPHLLVGMRNNLGAETRVRYAPSTHFYLRDKYEGRPWLTKLPFPVHVVERVEVHDHVSGNRFTTRYAYHHGYFDGEEREFRGFGMVEQWDTERFDALGAATNNDLASHVPAVHTKTWFHTGVYAGRDHVSTFHARDYYREPALAPDAAAAMLLPDTERPPGLTAAEERQACRALKGLMLRQEIYALDDTPAAQHPYVVTEQNSAVRRLQPADGDRFAVFYTHDRESIKYHYERNPNDPRVTHALTLLVDDYGNVRKGAAVGYGRRPGMSTLTGEDKARQEQTLITYAETDVTNAIDDDVLHPDDHRGSAAAESRKYEITGMAPASGWRFAFDDFARDGFAPIAALAAVPFETPVDYAAKRRRLTECTRVLYRKDDLTGLLATGALEPRGLTGETYQLALTSGLLARAFTRDGQPLLPADPAPVLAAADAGDGGGYVDLDGDGRWWIPSGRTFLSPHPAHDAAQELDYARQHFFLPHRYRDPFHAIGFDTESRVSYDAYDLLIVETRDAAGSRITAGERLPNGDLDPNVRGNDYRVLQPVRVMDANGNRTAVAYDVLGLLAATSVMGKPGENVGDLPPAAAIDLDPAAVLQHIANPLADPHAVLGGASTRLLYDLFAYERTKNDVQPQPAVVYALTRETHQADVPQGQSRITYRFSYSDGFGREIQAKVPAEPRKVNGVPGPPRWIGSGWTIFDNKGRPVRRYEPFFSNLPVAEGHRFEFGVASGVSPVFFYDPVGRVVATLHPSHAYEKIDFDPWQQVTWDSNDTVLLDPRTDEDVRGYMRGYFAALPAEPPWHTWYAMRANGDLGPEKQAAATRTVPHAGTAAAAHLDALGRPFLTIAHNGFRDDGSAIELATRVELDIDNRQLAVRDAVVQNGDARGRLAVRYEHDMLGTRLMQSTIDAGQQWMLSDVAGKPIRAWNSRRYDVRTEYDVLRRPRRRFTAGIDAAQPQKETLTELILYGEQRANGEADNLRGKAWMHFDRSGLITNERVDFKGNALRTSRRLAVDHEHVTDWSFVAALLPAFPGAVDEAAIDVAIAPRVEVEAYVTDTTYDALNRTVTVTSPHRAGMQFSTIRPAYNEAGMLERIDANLRGAAAGGDLLWTPFVTDVEYTAKGKRKRIDYATKDGKAITTTYSYERETCRLVRMYTRRGVDPATRDGVAFADDCDSPAVPPPAIVAPAVPPEGRTCGLQNLQYTYDPIGNITRIRDDARQAIYFRNKRVEPNADYSYDPLYRLVEASGREHLGQNGGAPIPHSHDDAPRFGISWADNDGNVLGTYVERYRYDDAGNMVEMSHAGADPAHPGWTRRFTCAEASGLEPGKFGNRLSETAVGENDPPPERYTYDAHGNITRMPHLAGAHPDPNLHWDDRDHLVRVDLGGGGTAWYVYDNTGQRVRKVWRKAANLIEERIYLGGFEIFRRRDAAGVVSLERETLHIFDDHRRVALVETRTIGDAAADPAPAHVVRYQFVNHLGSSALELDDEAQIISYEEYTPFGSTTYQAVRSTTETPKRYRYTGVERDEESGLEYHAARYYAPWLARWTSADPAGIQAGLNAYSYTSNNPVRARDRSGLADEEVTRIAQWLQAYVDSVPEDEWKQFANDPEWTTTTPSSRGTRYHTVLEAAIEFGWDNPNKVDITRVVSELHLDPDGYITAINTPPGAAKKDFRTADIGILKEGMSRELLAAKLAANEKIKASDVFDIALDYKTGSAELKKKEAFEKLSGVPYEKLSQGGNLPKTVGDALQRFGNAIKPSTVTSSLTTKTIIAGTAGMLTYAKPVLAAAGPVGDIAEAGIAAKNIADAPPEQRAQVAKEESFGFAGGWAGAAGGALLAGLICSSGIGCVVLGIGLVGAGGLAGDMFGREVAKTDLSATSGVVGYQDEHYIYYPGERIDKTTGEFQLRPGLKQ